MLELGSAAKPDWSLAEGGVVQVTRRRNTGNEVGITFSESSCQAGQSKTTSTVATRSGTSLREDYLVAFCAEYCWNGLEQNFEIEPNAPVLDVLQVESHVGFEGRIFASSHLP
jgi:hypothetical protein